MAPQTLWTRYAEERSPEDRDQLLLMNLPLVHHVARRMAGSLSRELEIVDLVGAGTMGLVAAVEHFDPSRGLAFSTFAAPRIRGAILDDLRSRDHASRSVRRKQRALAGGREAFVQAQGRAPRDHELAREVGVDHERFQQWRQDVESSETVSLEQPVREGDGASLRLRDVLEGAGEADVVDALGRSELLAMLEEAIGELKEQERVVLSLYYFEEMKLREIAEVLGVTESRVSQVRTRALATLRTRLAHLEEAA